MSDEPPFPESLCHRCVHLRVVRSGRGSTFLMCQEVGRRSMVPRQRGRIINVASVLALRGVPDQTAYCAAKHGVPGRMLPQPGRSETLEEDTCVQVLGRFCLAGGCAGSLDETSAGPRVGARPSAGATAPRCTGQAGEDGWVTSRRGL